MILFIPKSFPYLLVLQIHIDSRLTIVNLFSKPYLLVLQIHIDSRLTIINLFSKPLFDHLLVLQAHQAHQQSCSQIALNPSLYARSLALASSSFRTLASAGTILHGSVRSLLLSRSQVDVIVKRAFCAPAVMAGRGAKKGSFGGIGTAASLANDGVPEGASTLSDPSSRSPGNPVAQGMEHDSSGNPSGSSGAGYRHSSHRGGRGGRGGRGPMDSIGALGRCMTAILRHRASDYGLEMKSDGFVLVADLLKLSKKTAAGIPLSSHNEEDVRKTVAADGKQRFGLKEDDGKLYIRANQGHSIKTVESGQLLSLVLSPSQIPVCVHGTYDKFMSSIWQEGLKRMNRNHVHFATGLPKEDGVISGMRASVQVLIYLDVEKAMADGMQLYMSVNNVVLTEGFNGVVPTKYFDRVVKRLPHGKEVNLFPPTLQP